MTLLTLLILNFFFPFLHLGEGVAGGQEEKLCCHGNIQLHNAHLHC